MTNFFQKIKKIEKRGKLKIIAFALADIICISLSVFIAFLIRFELNIPDQYFFNIAGIIVLASMVLVPIFYFFKVSIPFSFKKE